MADEAEVIKQSEAIYSSVLGLLDELPSYEARALVVINWVKYVALSRADDLCPNKGEDAIAKFRLLCIEFAMKTVTLPDMLEEEQRSRCICPRCEARRSRAERPTEPAPKDEAIN